MDVAMKNVGRRDSASTRRLRKTLVGGPILKAWSSGVLIRLKS